MDTSPEYIKMCEKAVEIQTESFRYLMPDDFVVCRGTRRITTIWRVEACSLTTEAYSKLYIWLPRQDQLQAMVRGSRHMHLLAHEFSMWCHGGEEFGKQHAGYYNPHIDGDCSMEQLWLSFVMKEKYNKVWTGEDWA